MQASPRDVSYGLFVCVRFAYEPRTLLAALQAQVLSGACPIGGNVEVAVKLLWTMATFDSFLPRLFCHAMATVAACDSSDMALSHLYEVVVADRIAAKHGRAIRFSPTQIARAVRGFALSTTA